MTKLQCKVEIYRENKKFWNLQNVEKNFIRVIFPFWVYFRKALNACSSNEKDYLFINLRQFEEEVPLNSMQSCWSVKMPKTIQKGHCVRCPDAISVLKKACHLSILRLYYSPSKCLVSSLQWLVFRNLFVIKIPENLSKSFVTECHFYL